MCGGGGGHGQPWWMWRQARQARWKARLLLLVQPRPGHTAQGSDKEVGRGGGGRREKHGRTDTSAACCTWRPHQVPPPTILVAPPTPPAPLTRLRVLGVRRRRLGKEVKVAVEGAAEQRVVGPGEGVQQLVQVRHGGGLLREHACGGWEVGWVGAQLIQQPAQVGATEGQPAGEMLGPGGRQSWRGASRCTAPRPPAARPPQAHAPRAWPRSPRPRPRSVLQTLMPRRQEQRPPARTHFGRSTGAGHLPLR